MTLAANALQAALYARLTGVLGPVPVYDFVPPSAAFPYAVIGELTATPADTKSKDGQEFTVAVHAFAKGAGKKSTSTIVETIHAALHDQPGNLTLTGHHVTVLRVEFTQVLQENAFEGDTDHYYHGVQRVRAVVHNN